MTSEMTSGEIDKVGLALITWEQMIQETKHYKVMTAADAAIAKAGGAK